GASGAAAYSGSISFDSAGATRTAAISGGKATRIGPYHWSDANGDFRVDDGEVMPAYYLSEEMKGLGLDWETVEAIWSGKGYRWDAAGRRYEVLR
ncbi:MAG TPA: XRE family transcriptional regulator, partial [Verrucomicrobiae bacterium]|nr:XRE family transcriptional regulator [Verrucomicrobiae bacterium]